MLSTMKFFLKKNIFQMILFFKKLQKSFQAFCFSKLELVIRKKNLPPQMYIGLVYRYCTCTFQEVMKYFVAALIHIS